MANDENLDEKLRVRECMEKYKVDTGLQGWIMCNEKTWKDLAACIKRDASGVDYISEWEKIFADLDEKRRVRECMEKYKVETGLQEWIMCNEKTWKDLAACIKRDASGVDYIPEWEKIFADLGEKRRVRECMEKYKVETGLQEWIMSNEKTWWRYMTYFVSQCRKTQLNQSKIDCLKKQRIQAYMKDTLVHAGWQEWILSNDTWQELAETISRRRDVDEILGWTRRFAVIRKRRIKEFLKKENVEADLREWILGLENIWEKTLAQRIRRDSSVDGIPGWERILSGLVKQRIKEYLEKKKVEASLEEWIMRGEIWTGLADTIKRDDTDGDYVPDWEQKLAGFKRQRTEQFMKNKKVEVGWKAWIMSQDTIWKDLCRRIKRNNSGVDDMPEWQQIFTDLKGQRFREFLEENQVEDVLKEWIMSQEEIWTDLVERINRWYNWSLKYTPRWERIVAGLKRQKDVRDFLTKEGVEAQWQKWIVSKEMILNDLAVHLDDSDIHEKWEHTFAKIKKEKVVWKVMRKNRVDAMWQEWIMSNEEWKKKLSDNGNIPDWEQTFADIKKDRVSKFMKKIGIDFERRKWIIKDDMWKDLANSIIRRNEMGAATDDIPDWERIFADLKMRRVRKFLDDNKVEAGWQAWMMSKERIWKCLDESINKMDYKSFFLIPERGRILAAFKFCPMSKVKVVILGHDPLPDASKATGMAFSLPEGTREYHEYSWSAMRRLHAVLRAIYPNCPPSFETSCCHINWAEKGVLLLNSSLTYEYLKREWIDFVNVLLEELLDEVQSELVVVFWGSWARHIYAKLRISKPGLFGESSHHKLFMGHHPTFTIRNLNDAELQQPKMYSADDTFHVQASNVFMYIDENWPGMFKLEMVNSNDDMESNDDVENDRGMGSNMNSTNEEKRKDKMESNCEMKSNDEMGSKAEIGGNDEVKSRGEVEGKDEMESLGAIKTMDEKEGKDGMGSKYEMESKAEFGGKEGMESTDNVGNMDEIE